MQTEDNKFLLFVNKRLFVQHGAKCSMQTEDNKFSKPLAQSQLHWLESSMERDPICTWPKHNGTRLPLVPKHKANTWKPVALASRNLYMLQLQIAWELVQFQGGFKVELAQFAAIGKWRGPASEAN